MALLKAEFEQNKLAYEELIFKVRIQGSQTQGSILCFTDGTPLVYHEDDTRAVTLLDAAPGFALTDLDNDAAPAVLGMVIPVGDAAEIVDINVPVKSIVNTGLTGAMTAGVVTLRGASSTGVTASKNIAFTLSCTALDIDEDNATSPNCTFFVIVKYRKSQPGIVA